MAGGEIGPTMRARIDLNTYQKAVARLENFIALAEGGSRYRTGTMYVDSTRGNRLTRLIEFQFNDEQAYVIEATDQKFRFYKDNAIITETPIDITAMTDGVFTAVGSAFTDGDEIFLDGIVGPERLNGNFYLVINATANTFEITDVNGEDVSDLFADNEYESGGTVAKVYEIDTPYLEADLERLQTPQNADTMYIVSRKYKPRKLTRSGHADWALARFAMTGNPFGSITSLDGDGDCPGAACFLDSGRIMYGGTDNHPETIWASRSPQNASTDYDDFTIGNTPTHALKFTLSPINGVVDSIQWISNTSKFTIVGCFGTIRLLYGNSLTEAISPIAVQAKGVTKYGASEVMPIANGTTLFYVQRGKRILRSLEYDFLQDWYTAIDRNLITKHLSVPGYKRIVMQQGSPDVLWCLREDGKLVGLTYIEKEDVAGWHRHYIGGSHIDSDGVLKPWAKVMSIAIMRRSTGYDQLWIAAERYINGRTVRSVEYLTDVIDYPVAEDFYSGVAGKQGTSADKTTFNNVMWETQKHAVHVDMAVAFDATNSDSALTFEEAPPTPLPGIWLNNKPVNGSTHINAIRLSAPAPITVIDLPAEALVMLCALAVDGANNRLFHLESFGSHASLRCEKISTGAAGDDAFAAPARVTFSDYTTHHNLATSNGNQLALSADGLWLYAAVLSIDDRATIIKVSTATGFIDGVYDTGRDLNNGLGSWYSLPLITISPDGLRLYAVTPEQSVPVAVASAIHSVDTESMTAANVLAVDIGDQPSRMRMSSDGSSIIMNTSPTSYHSIFNTSDFTLTPVPNVDNFNISTDADFLPYSSSGIYVLGRVDSDTGTAFDIHFLHSVDVVSGAITGTWDLTLPQDGTFASPLIVDPLTGYVYMVFVQQKTVCVFDPATGVQLDDIILPGVVESTVAVVNTEVV